METRRTEAWGGDLKVYRQQEILYVNNFLNLSLTRDDQVDDTPKQSQTIIHLKRSGNSLKVTKFITQILLIITDS